MPSPSTSYFRRGVFREIDRREGKRAPRTASIIILTITAFIGSSLVLAAMTVVPEVTRAKGEIVPTGLIRQVESYDGGVILSVVGVEGEHVARGDLLAVLGSAELDQLQADIAQELGVVTDRLAVQHGIRAALSAADEHGRTTAPSQQVDPGDYVVQRLALFNARQDVQQGLVAHLGASITDLEASLQLATEQQQARQVPLDRLEALLASGLTTQNDVFTARQSRDEARATVLDVKLRLDQAQQDLSNAQAVVLDNILALREEASREIFALEGQLATLAAREASLAMRRQKLEIRAPESGILQAVAFPNPGEVIEPGETMFEIVPTDLGLVAQIEIDPVDIGHIAVGDRVTLKVDTFDARRYGQITGRITSISPNSVFDEATGKEFFRAILSLDRTTIGDGAFERNLQAGMNASAEIVTDERSMMTYLLKPISRSLESAFRER